MIGDTRNRCDLVYAEIGIFDSQVYFVPELTSTPDTVYKVRNDDQEYGGTNRWCQHLCASLQ